MKRFMIGLIYALVAFCIPGFPSISKANVSVQKAFSFVAMDVVPDPQDSMVVTVTLSAEILHAGSVRCMLDIPEGVENLGSAESDIQAATNQTIQPQWSVRVTKDGYFLLEMTLVLDPDDPNVSPPIARSQTFECYLNARFNAIIAGTSEPDPAFFQAGENPFDPETALCVASSSPPENPTGITITVTVSGRIVYRLDDPCYAADPLRGVPGVRVVMDWGDNDNTPASQYRPYHGPDPLGNEGID